MRILAIDAATVNTGFAVINAEPGNIQLFEWGKIVCKGDLDTRLGQLYNRIIMLVEKYEPDKVAVEDLKFNRGTPNLSSMTKVAFAIGVVRAAFCNSGHEDIVSITANSVRKTWEVGQKKAKLREAINKKFHATIINRGRPDGFKTADEDITDAIGLAVTAWTRRDD